MLAAADKLQGRQNSDAKFGAFYMPGPVLVRGDVLGARRPAATIAKQDGDKWVGQLSEPAVAARACSKWADLVKKYSKATRPRTRTTRTAIFAQGQTGMFYGNRWEQGAVQEQIKKDPNDPNSPMVDTKVKGKVGGRRRCPSIPSFLGGSDLGVTAKSQNKELAAQWIKYFTDSKSQAGLIAKGALPNATALLDKAAADRRATRPAALAAKNSWFVPNGAEVGGRREGQRSCRPC